MYKAIDLANYIVDKCIKDNAPITNPQLQRILYFVQKEFLKRGSQAFSDYIEAWEFGPVVPNVYYYFCGFGAMPISISRGTVPNLSTDKNIIDNIVENKRSLTPWEAAKETHKITGAWSKVYNNGKGSQRIIPVDFLRFWRVYPSSEKSINVTISSSS